MGRLSLLLISLVAPSPCRPDATMRQPIACAFGRYAVPFSVTLRPTARRAGRGSDPLTADGDRRSGLLARTPTLVYASFQHPTRARAPSAHRKFRSQYAQTPPRPGPATAAPGPNPAAGPTPSAQAQIDFSVRAGL